jgi:hypothetical protein
VPRHPAQLIHKPEWHHLLLKWVAKCLLQNPKLPQAALV